MAGMALKHRKQDSSIGRQPRISNKFAVAPWACQSLNKKTCSKSGKDSKTIDQMRKSKAGLFAMASRFWKNLKPQANKAFEFVYPAAEN